MSAHNDTETDYRIPESGFWAGAWRYPAVLAVVGLVLAAIGFGADPDRFGYSYLFAVMSVLTLVFGGMFLVLIEHFTAGHWGVTTRRIAEVLMAGAPVVAVLVLPIIVGSLTGAFPMYDEWMHADDHGEAVEAEHGEEHGALLGGAATASAQGHGEAAEVHDADAHDADAAHAHSPQDGSGVFRFCTRAG